MTSTESDERQTATPRVSTRGADGTASRSRRVTHRDVARRAGVSPAVVSYVINNGPRPTSPATRERVLRAIDELGYHPNAVARGLRAQRTHTVGFVDCDYSPLDVYVSPYSASILTGITAELSRSGYHALIYPLLIGQDLAALRGMLLGGRLDGVVVRLVEDSATTTAVLDVISSAGIPCVCIERSADLRYGFGSVVFDDTRGAFEATRYLLERGYRRIGHLHGDRRYATAQARYEGYVRALESFGVAVDEQLVQGMSWGPFDVDASVARLLSLADPPTALFAASDSLAFRAIEVLRASGRRVPDDVAVMGFDDIPLASEMIPPLTTVRIPLVDLGRRAAGHLLDLMEDETAAATGETLPVEVIGRGTA
jgi:LacI family transcriptional regulator